MDSGLIAHLHGITDQSASTHQQIGPLPGRLPADLAHDQRLRQWSIDDFHGRVSSVLYLTPALGALLLWRAAAAIEMLTLGVTLTIGGFIPIVGVSIVNSRVHKIDWTQPGTWAWNATFAALLLCGVGLIWRSAAQEREPTR